MRVTPSFITLVVCFLFGVIPSAAGDVASFDFLGFSKEGHAYYTEFGRQEASGYPYATLSRSSSAGGELLERVFLHDSSAKVEDARLQLLRSTQGTKLSGGEIVFSRTHTDLGSNDQTVSFFLNSHFNDGDVPVRAVLSIEERPASQDCYGFFDTEKQLSLHLSRSESSVLFVADRIKVKGCARNYRFGRAFVDENEIGKRRLALFLMVDRLGFEGIDVRWMGFTIELSDDP